MVDQGDRYSLRQQIWEAIYPESGMRKAPKNKENRKTEIISFFSDHAAEAMVTVAFNLGARSIDLTYEERLAVAERIIVEVRMIMRGAQAMAESI